MTEFEKYLKLEIEQVEKDQKLEDTEYRQGKKYAYYTALNAFKNLFIHSVVGQSEQLKKAKEEAYKKGFDEGYEYGHG